MGLGGFKFQKCDCDLNLNSFFFKTNLSHNNMVVINHQGSSFTLGPICLQSSSHEHEIGLISSVLHLLLLA